MEFSYVEFNLKKNNINEGFPGGAVVKNPVPMEGPQVRALVREDSACGEQLSPCTAATEPAP